MVSEPMCVRLLSMQIMVIIFKNFGAIVKKKKHDRDKQVVTGYFDLIYYFISSDIILIQFSAIFSNL